MFSAATHTAAVAYMREHESPADITDEYKFLEVKHAVWLVLRMTSLKTWFIVQIDPLLLNSEAQKVLFTFEIVHTEAESNMYCNKAILGFTN
jgi:hypothetical protein